MFGYIRPFKSELYVKDSEFYSAVYCGLCRHGGKNISHLTRWLLNYDFVLLALLRIALTEEKVCVCKKRCPYKLKKTACVSANESFGFVCSAFAHLTYAKLLDDVKDERGFKRFAKRCVKPIFSHISKKADKYEGLYDVVIDGLAATDECEKAKCSSIDRAADGFATMMKQIAAYGLTEQKKQVAEICGYHIGRFIYAIDAYDDLLRDEKSGNYNPLLLKYGSSAEVLSHKDEIEETLFDSLNAFSNHYALIASNPPNSIDRLIYNIVELGGRNAVRRISERYSPESKGQTNEKPL